MLPSHRERRGEAPAASAAVGALGEASPTQTPQRRVLEGDALPGKRTWQLNTAHPEHPEKEHGGTLVISWLCTGSAWGNTFPGRRDALWLSAEPCPLPDHSKSKMHLPDPLRRRGWCGLAAAHHHSPYKTPGQPSVFAEHAASQLLRKHWRNCSCYSSRCSKQRCQGCREPCSSSGLRFAPRGCRGCCGGAGHPGRPGDIGSMRDGAELCRNKIRRAV